jgi:hypothetical protein
MLDAAALHPVGRASRQVLLEEHVAGMGRGADAVDPTLAGGGAIRGVRDHHGRDGGVVGQHLALGGAVRVLGRRRVRHLVEVGQPQPMAFDGDELSGGGGHVHKVLGSEAGLQGGWWLGRRGGDLETERSGSRYVRPQAASLLDHRR